MTNWWSKAVAGVALATIAFCATAGGLVVRRDSVRFESGTSRFEPRAKVSISFLVNEFVYGSNEYAYLSWAVVPADASIRPKAIDMEHWEVYGVLRGTPQKDIGLEESSAPYVLNFAAPELSGKYKVVISGIPIFRKGPLKTGAGYKQSFIPHLADRRELAKAFLDYSDANIEVTRLEVTDNQITVNNALSVYLRLNGKIPTQVATPGGVGERPMVFSWEIGEEFKGDRKKLLYRYRLQPDNKEWGAWGRYQDAHYSYIAKGVKQFQVQARYDMSEPFDSRPAAAQFYLPDDYISKATRAVLTKAPIGTPLPDADSISFTSLYPKSRALLVGIWKFDDKSLPAFGSEKIALDISTMKAALTRHGFEVDELNRERVTRDDIAAALSSLVGKAGRDDRLFVYFSTHGFPDPGNPSEGYLATSDCDVKNPVVRCVRLNELQSHADRGLDGKFVRQILFAVDSCFAGLGIIRKGPVDLENLSQLAVPQGSFMLTAGMANQLAQIDATRGMSVFTYHLAKGLEGSADLLGNSGLITLSELFVYVQYNVAKDTNAKQIPMLGRMRGDGEMLFQAK